MPQKKKSRAAAKKKTNRQPTQVDVARLAGLSQPMVSFYLNDKDGAPNISEQARKKIEKAIRELNYRPNASARAMRSRKFFNIGYFLPDRRRNDGDHYLFRAGIFDGAAKEGYNVFMIRRPSDELEQEGESGKAPEVPRILNEAHLDALIVNSNEPLSADVLQAIKRSGLPVVYLNQKKRHNSIYVDDIHGMREITEHVIGHGCKKIAYFRPCSWGETHHSDPDRVKAYSDAMRAHGLEPLLKIPQARYTRSETREWLMSADRPEAVICYEDNNALRIFNALYRTGLHVPEDLLLTGYNKDEICTPVSLTTMNINRYEMGRAAVEMAIALAGKDAKERLPSRAVVPSLVLGESTAQKCAGDS